MFNKAKKVNLLVSIFAILSIASCQKGENGTSLAASSTGGNTSTSKISPSTDESEISTADVSSSEKNSSISESSMPTKKTPLAAPSGLKIVKGVFSWNKVENAVFYDVNLGNTKLGSVEETSFDLSTTFTDAGEFVLSVVANPADDDPTFTFSEKTELEITIHKLETPVVRVEKDEDGVSYFSWNAVENAVGYEISLDNGKTFEKLDRTATSYHPKGLGFYQIQVKASGLINGTEFYLSSELSALSERIGSESKIDDAGHLSFVAIDGASKYDLYLNGALVKENVSQQDGVDLATKENPLITKTGVYSVSVKALKDDGTLIKEISAGSYVSGILNRNEIYSFDNNVMPSLFTRHLNEKLNLSLDEATKHGEEGYALKGEMKDATDPYAYMSFDLSGRNDFKTKLDTSNMISVWFYAEKPTDLVPNENVSDEYLPDGAIPWLDFSTGWTKNVSKEAWAKSDSPRIDAMDAKWKKATKVKYKEWTKLYSLLPTDGAGQKFMKEHGALIFDTSIAKGDWGYESWTNPVPASEPATTGFNFWMDDLYFEDYKFNVKDLGVEGVNYAVSNGGSGQEATFANRIVLEIPNAVEGATYKINLKFKVMNSVGMDIYGNGPWERRLILTDTPTTAESVASTYCLPGIDTLSDGQKASHIDWTKSGYDPEVNPDGTWDLPTADTELTWNKNTLITAHEVGDTGKIGCALLLRDFAAGDIVQITDVSFEYQFNTSLFPNNEWTQNLRWSPSGQELKPNTQYNVTMKWGIMNRADGGNISGAGKWGRRLQWGVDIDHCSNDKLYWLSFVGSHKPSFQRDGQPALPLATDLIDYSGTLKTDENGKFLVAIFDFNGTETIFIHDITVVEATV